MDLEKISIPVPVQFIEALALFHAKKETAPKIFESGLLCLTGLKIELTSAEWTDEKIAMTWLVPDRNTLEAIPLKFTSQFPNKACTVEQLAEYIHNVIVQIVSHEVEEMLLIRGKRNDPHAVP